MYINIKIFSCILILPLLFSIDMIFSTTLLQKIKTLHNSKYTHNSTLSINMIANDTSKPSSSKTKTVIFNDDIENIQYFDNTTSDSENISDTQDTGKFK